MNGENIYGDPLEIPVGLSMALASNAKAFKAFSALPIEEQNVMIRRAWTVQNRADMWSIVKELESRGTPQAEI